MFEVIAGVAVLLFAGGFVAAPWVVLGRRAARRRSFVGHGLFCAVGFGQVAWGRPDLNGKDVSLALMAVGVLVALQVVGAGVGIAILVGATVPSLRHAELALYVLGIPALLIYPRTLGRFVRLPRVRRLFFDQHGLRLDWLLCTHEPTTERLLCGRSSRGTRFVHAWEEVRAVTFDESTQHVVIELVEERDLHFGPMTSAEGASIVSGARSRLAATRGPVRDDALVRLHRLTKRAR